MMSMTKKNKIFISFLKKSKTDIFKNVKNQKKIFRTCKNIFIFYFLFFIFLNNIFVILNFFNKNRYFINYPYLSLSFIFIEKYYLSSNVIIKYFFVFLFYLFLPFSLSLPYIITSIYDVMLWLFHFMITTIVFKNNLPFLPFLLSNKKKMLKKNVSFF